MRGVHKVDRFPDVATVTISNIETNELIPNIAILVTLFAMHKNNYHLIPAVSNINGVIKIEKSWLNSEVEKNRNIFCMDYSSNLDDCLRKMEISVMNVNQINKAIKGMTQWKNVLNISEKEIQMLMHVDNGLYNTTSCIHDFNGQDSVNIDIKIRKNA